MRKANPLSPVALGAAVVIAAAFSGPVAASTIFSETFDTPASSANFTSTAFTPSDVYIEYGFDYSGTGSSRLTTPIPAAPGGGSMSGVIVAANLTGVALDAGVNIFPIVPPSGNYKLTFDVWAGVNGGSGTTEFIMAGANTSGTEVNIDAGLIDDRDGDWFEHSTEGGIGSDFITFTSVGGTQFAIDFIGNADAPLSTALPSPPYPTVGAAGEGWATYEVVATQTDTEFYINGVLISTLSGSDYSIGLPMFGYSDIFSSVAGGDSALVATGGDFDPFDASFAIFDNVTVMKIPEPTSLLLIGLSSLGLVGARRRS